MAHKSSPRKSLKSLFSRGEAQPGQPAEKDASQRGGEKKKFKFPKLKIKTKRSSEEADSGSQQALSAAEPTETVENGEALADGVVPDKKKSFLYATAPRSKSKEFSYSELDLRKPKRFATFSFGLKKRRKDEDSISKSTFGLHSPGIKEQEETNLDVSQMELDQANSKRFSMSQPELDTSVKFDIPSPPAVATNQSESYFTLPNQSQSLVTINTQPESEEALKNGSKLLDVHEETPKAPIASIPELQLDDQEWNNPVGDYSSSKAATFPAPVTHAASISVDTQAAPSPPARQHPVTHDASSPEAAVLTPRDNDFLQQPYTNNEISLAESTSATLSHHQPDAPDTADGGEPPSLSVDSKTDATITESTPVPHDDDDSSTIREVSASCTDGILPEAANSVTTTSAISSKKMTPSSADVIYDTLYESLFPQSFTSEVMSSLSNPPPQICTDVRQLKANPEPIMLKTLHEHYKETNFTYSRPSSSCDSAACGVDQAERRLPENFEVATSNERFTRHQSSAVTDPQANKDIYPSHSSAGEEIPYSELICSQSKVKSDNLSLFGDAGGAVSAVHNSAPPAPEYVTPQGTDTQVTGSKGRVILVKESLSDKTAVVSDCPSPVPNKMSTLDDLELKIETRGGPFAGSGLVEAPEGLLSPVYLSLGSDDGSVVEVYYSAEEDHVEESGEEDVYTIQEGEELCAAEGVKEIAEKGRSGRDEGDSSDEEEMQCEASKIEAGTSEFLSCNAKRTEVEVAAAAFPQVKQEGEEGGGEELPATLVRQGMVCDVGPPSCEQHVQGECSDGNLTRDLETEDHWKEEKQPPSQEIENLACKDTRSVRFVDTACSDTAEDVITPTPGEAGEQVSADRREESSQETNSNATTSAGAEFVRGVSAHIPELQSDAIEIEHNRALQSSEWADTITPSAGRKGSGPEQAAVELSNSNPETLSPEAAAEVTSERPAEAQTDQDPGSLTVSRTSAAASESQQTKVDQGLVDEMNSGYGSLSTKVTIKHLAPLKEDEATNRFHKVSLIAEGDRLSQDTEDSTKTTRTESDEFKWRNNFEGVFQYKPQPAEESSFSDSLSNKISDPSSLFSSSEATAHKPFSSMFSSFAPAPEERFTLDSRLYDGTNVYLSHESEPEAEPQYEWRRRSGLVEQEEPAAPVGERRGEAESERIKSRWDSQQLPASGFPSPLRTSHADAFEEENGDCSSEFTGVFKATLVVLDPAAPPSTPPGSPETDSPIQFEMDNLVDTLRSMGPSLRPRTMGQRLPPQGPISSLPPIVEDASSPATADTPDSVTSPAKTMDITPAEPLNGVYLLPADLGLKRNSSRDTRSPLELMKQQQQDQQPQSGARGLNLPQRASAINSNLMRKPSDSSPEDLKSPVLNGNGLLSSSNTGSRLENSVIYGGYMSSSVDQTAENGKAQRSLYRSGSLPETGPLSDRVSVGPKELTEISAGKDPVGSRFDRISFLLSSSTSGSMTGAEDPNARMSRPPPLGIGSPTSSNSPTRLLSPTGSVDLHRPFVTPDSPLSLFNQTHGMGLGAGAGNGTLGTPILQRSFSSEGTVRGQQTSLFNSVQTKEPELDRNSTLKYRAFPDAYLTKEKEHGKLNPRPGKMYIFDRPGMCGQRIEVCSDVVDAQSWELQETISIRVVRGGWVLYEKPNFKGEKIALDEGDIVLTNPFSPPEELMQNGQEDGETSDQQADTQPARKFVIGSVRRAVRDYSVPEICLFPEENAEGKKVIFRDTSDDARIFGFPIKSNSVIINAGLWLVYAEPFFQGVPRVLEVGGYPNPAAWGVENPYVGSLHPLKIGEPRVENMHEPKIEIYEKPYFCGKSRIITANMKDFMTRTDRQQTVFMYSVGSLRVLGGIWVGYEKEGFRGHQYLLEEGEYHDWRVWGGCDAELRSVRVIRADLSDPMMVMFEQPEEDQDGMQENTFEVTEAIPDVELFGYKTSTRSIHVISGAWVAYSHVDFSGDQYILEKGFYNNCADWGSQDTHICSVQPVLQAPRDNMRSRTEIILYSEPDFRGQCHIFDRNHDSVSEKFLIKSCRVVGGHWVVYENQQFSGNMYVLLEGDYPNLTSMGCPPNCTIRSVKVVPMTFSVPSISLFGLECLEGREITTETEIINMAEEGFNDHFLSVRVNSGCWVVCEHSNYRGRQFLLEPIEITNWPKFSSLHTIGSMYPVRQKRHFLRIKNNESGHYMSVQGGMEELKSGRVVATEEVEPMSDIWYYQDGFIKNKLSPNMSLQVMGNIEPAAKVVMWTETRQPTQTWTAKMRGLITSLTFPGMVLDVKGGKSYDKDHLVIMPENEERPSQQWIIELL